MKLDKFAPLATIIVIVLLGVTAISYPFVKAMGTERVVNVTAKVALDCTVETHMYTEDCIKRFTDDIASARAVKEKTRKNLDDAIEKDKKADKLLDQALENYNTIYGK